MKLKVIRVLIFLLFIGAILNLWLVTDAIRHGKTQPWPILMGSGLLVAIAWCANLFAYPPMK